MFPPWFCKAFGKLPSKEREKLIVDNRLCPFCLLHDKDKPCGAKERPVSAACAAASCKGRHIQKLHDFLKDVLREEKRVHVVQGDGEWEESEEAWELGDEEMMIVGTVQQEDNCSWQEACNAWVSQGEEVAMGMDQEVIERVTVSQCKKADGAGEGEKALELEGLLLEGEEQEYFLELLMRKASPERPRAVPAAKGKAPLPRARRAGKRRRGLVGEASMEGRLTRTWERGEQQAQPAV
jgi:hypothetical protein